MGSLEVANWIERQIPRLTDEIHAAIVDKIEAYRDPALVPSEDLHRSIRHNLRFMVAALAHPDAPPDLSAPALTGAHRARQGMPLPEVLRAYRLTFAGLWTALRDNPRLDPSTLLDLASRLWELTDEHAIAVTEAYRSTTAAILVTQQRRREALVEALFTGHRQGPAGPWEAGQLLGLPPDASHLVIAAETCGLVEESLPEIEQHLAEAGLSSAWRLTPALQVGIVALADDRQDEVLRIVRDLATARTGISPPYRPLEATPRALNLARIALGGIPADSVAVEAFSPSPLAAAVAQDPVEARRLADSVFGGLRSLTTEDRAVLLDTLQAYLDNDGSVERAGATLHCHPNTVRYRLRRLHQLTGRATTDPIQAAELAAATYALNTLPAGDR